MKEKRETVMLREKVLKDGRTSLYLDIYKGGERKYEFLHLYLWPETDRKVKEQNQHTRLVAEAIKSKRALEMQRVRYGMPALMPDEVLFREYFESLMVGKESKTADTWKHALAIVTEYDRRERLTFADITPQWVRGLRDFMEHSESRKTAGVRRKNSSNALYFAKVKAVIHQAIADDIIQRDPTLSVKGFRSEDAEKMYLSIDEIRTLSQTPCSHQRLKEAFLFSCLTGLRISDVIALRWKDVSHNGEFVRIQFVQQKTRQREYLDVSPQAETMMGERGEPDDKVFILPHRTLFGTILQRWMDDAGIVKHITFHCARHTFATMMLELGTDLYTVSKLLGHRKIATTQVYAKVLDRSKQAAVRNIPQIL